MNLSHVLLGPVVTEKAIRLSEEKNQHVLSVHSDANKKEIAQAVEIFFGAKVREVKIIKMPKKIRVRGKFGPQVKRKEKKKAVVRLAEGQSLDLLKPAPEPRLKKDVKKLEKKAPESSPVSSS
ncbi:50S ribosomal protein L23 [Candidatus Peregrinibacteria bacterium]|nr:MAG: 50S ribosomal protein L23 [Candidatus Peregrinibacteria bacterium]